MPTIPATNWVDLSVISLEPLNGIIMEDTVCLMEDSTYTMDDAVMVGPSPTNWSNQTISATNWS